jgi:L,D-peptidoglycan transpeptidase YkuD (ErfK/YbiS/YcfS/YnhG family)
LLQAAHSLALDLGGKQSVSRPRRTERKGSRTPQARTARVLALSSSARRGMVKLGSLSFPCALGRSGCRVPKREGDGATPVGTWRMREVLFRPDRVRRPATQLPARPLRPHDGWCDAAGDRNYNRSVRLPYPASAEEMWRTDHLYDVVVVLGHNERPRRRGGGSAIFVHVAQPDFAPTQGCVAIALPHLLRLLRSLGGRAAIAVLAPPGKKGARSRSFGR